MSLNCIMDPTYPAAALAAAEVTPGLYVGPARDYHPTKVLFPITGKLLELLHMSREQGRERPLSVQKALQLHSLTWDRARVMSVSPANQRQVDYICKLDEDVICVTGILGKMDLTEAYNVLYISDRLPDFPLPKILGAVQAGDCIWLYRSRAERHGVPLDRLWPFFTDLGKRSMQTKLVGLFQKLRDLQRNSENPWENQWMGSCKQCTCNDMLKPLQLPEGGIQTEAHFNEFLFMHKKHPMLSDDPIRELRDSMPTNHTLKLSHGNLKPSNIMVSKPNQGHDFKVLAIKDWRYAGWYPEYWDYVQARHNAAWERRRELKDRVDYLPTEAIGKYEDEYETSVKRVDWLNKRCADSGCSGGVGH